MHVRSKAQRHSIAGGGSKIICREKQEPRNALLCGSTSLLRQAERLQVGLSTAEVIAKP
jgi:hypothetical protein